MIWFQISMTPYAWQRVKQSRFGHCYIPDKTRKFEADFAAAASTHRPLAPLDGPLAIDLVFTVTRPKKSPRRPWPHCRPDLDNYVKGVLDALKSFWGDDGQVCRITAEKRYGDSPSIIVRIQAIETKNLESV